MSASVARITADLGLTEKYPLIEEQVVSLHDLGWTFLPGLLNTAATETIRDALKQVNVRRPLKPGDPAYTKIPDPKDNRKYESLAWQSPFFRELATSPRLSAVGAQLMRMKEVLFTQDMSFIKPPDGSPTKFHQDFPYFPFDRKGSVSIWIALIDMTEDMGTLRYLEKSHYEGPLGRVPIHDIRDVYPHLYQNVVSSITSVRAGDALVHVDLTVHGAGPNRSAIPREAYVIRYMRPDTIYTGLGHPHYENFPHLKVGETFAESEEFDLVGVDGVVSKSRSWED